ncbi:MAG: MAPEG family protein [Kordiimonadaceae bacterium]|nr:MAPEG family protein [Kordiimonadaceae bacterium]
MIIPVISGYTASILAVLTVVLMMTVGNARRTTGINLGDGGNEDLLLKIRRHGNLIESAPLFLILLGLLEAVGGPTDAVIGLAIVYVVARLAHAYSLSGKDKPMAARAIGALGTVIGLLGTAGTLAWQLSALG